MNDPSLPDVPSQSQSSPHSDDETLAGTQAGSTTRGRIGLTITAGARIGRYVALREIGRGAMGRVWAAVDPELDRKVAVKVLARAGDTEHDRRTLLREAQAMARLDDPNVVAVHDVGLHAEHVFIAMDFVDGEPLDAWLVGAPRTTEEILAVLCQAGRGLAAAHAADIVHRDFKPPNILVGHDGRVRVADFGIAHGARTNEEADAPEATIATRSGVIGTPAYMSPEQHDTARIDHRSDQFSFCVTMFEALAGRRPFRGSSLAELATAKIEGRVDETAAERIPRRLRVVILRGLASEPAARHPSMTALLAAIEDARRQRWPRVLAVAAGLVVLGGVASWAAREPAVVDPCSGADERVASVWNAQRSASLRVNADGTTESFARDRARALRVALDGLAEDWRDSYARACAAAHDPGASERARRLAACVDQRLENLRGLVDAATGEGLGALSIDPALEAVSPASECTGDAMTDWLPAPSDPLEAQRVLALRGRIDRVRWARVGGRAADLAAVELLAKEAADAGDPYTHATAQIELAASLSAVGNSEPAEAAREDAMRVALLAGLDRLAARAINQQILHMRPQQIEEARRLAVVGAALVERTGTPDEVHGHLALNLGNLYRHVEKHELAAEQYDLAEARYLEALGPTSLWPADARVAKATLWAATGRTQEVLDVFEDAIEAYREHGQYDSPRAVALRERRSILMIRTGRLRDARGPLAEAVRAAEAIFGPAAQGTANGRGVLAILDGIHGRFHEARIGLWLSHGVAAPPGDRDEMWAEAWGQMAQVESIAGNLDWAAELAERCDAALTRAYGSEPTIWRIVAPSMRADIERRRGDYEAALAYAERARDVFPVGRAPSHPSLLEVHAIATLSAAALHRADEAAAWASALPEEPPLAPEVHALVALARAVVAPPGDPKARAEVLAARAVAARELWSEAHQLRELDAWLGGRWPLVDPQPRED